MVDSKKDEDDGGLNFDDMVGEADFYQNEIRDKQGSTYVSNLAKDEVPDFIKNGQQNKERTNITDLMYVGIEDESLQTYKERLLGNLDGVVQRATALGKATPRKSNVIH